MTDEEAKALLAAAVPANVRTVCSTLTAAGHQAVTVGGAVRDALLGRAPGDWDVATSAHPDQVLALFRHTVPTGLAHGTVTIVTGRGEDSHVEVTTFRGEGAYTDARRPDHVVFGVLLVEDLARRDLVVNAMAYDPATGELHDPFGGRADIAARRLRAVGTPVDRFTEDGLRVMRAVRFAAVLEFDLDPDTEAGIPPALASLAKVSRERISDELRKILATRQPSRALRVAVRTGIMTTILPELAAFDAEAWASAVDAATPRARLGTLITPLAARPTIRIDRDASRAAEDVLRRLKFSNDELKVAAALVGVAGAVREPIASERDVRWLLADVGRAIAPIAVELWHALGAYDLAARAAVICARGDALVIGELAVTGKALIDTLGLSPGPLFGRLLAALLSRVIEDPTLNTRDRLFDLARTLSLELSE
jgi:tRNA nucleotidyltransferase (CCA-adding enzyme)